jgi:predicted DNA binding CopG/RHH family protein
MESYEKTKEYAKNICPSKQEERPMSAPEKTGFDAQVHFRVPSDFMPLVHYAARRQGMTTSSFVRSVLHRELDRLGVSYATAELAA